MELVRSLGVEVVSSADFAQRFEAVLSPAQIESHHAAGKALLRARDGEHQAQKSKRDDQFGAGVVERVEATVVHKDPGAQHVQCHQDTDWKHRQAEDHRGTADELEQDVHRPGDRR